MKVYNFVNPSVNTVQQTKNNLPRQNGKLPTGKISFSDLLDKKLNGESELKFSKHAQKRLFSREINFGAKDLNSLKEVVKKLNTKGAKESLIFMNREHQDNLAVVVSVRNKTVITAMNSEDLKDNVFTNIDSAAVL